MIVRLTFEVKSVVVNLRFVSRLLYDPYSPVIVFQSLIIHGLLKVPKLWLSCRMISTSNFGFSSLFIQLFIISSIGAKVKLLDTRANLAANASQ